MGEMASNPTRLTAARGRRGGASGKRAQRAAEAAEAARLTGAHSSAPSTTPREDQSSEGRWSHVESRGEEASVWAEFCAQNAKVHGANLQLRHFLGSLDGLSVGQVETLQEVMRRLCLELEECRVRLARAQEREEVLAHVALELERQGSVASIDSSSLSWAATVASPAGVCAPVTHRDSHNIAARAIGMEVELFQR